MAIHGFVESINHGILNKFDFGDSDARRDTLLDDCYCVNPSYSDVLVSGNKNIILGERGAGKTALFLMLTESKRRISFQGSRNSKHLLLPIYEYIDYKSIKIALLKKLQPSFPEHETVMMYRYIWELYMIYSIASKVSKEYPRLPSNVKSTIEHITSLFEVKSHKESSMMNVLLDNKKTISIKLGNLIPGVTLLDLSLSAEPSNNVPAHTNNKEIRPIDMIDIEASKKIIYDYLDSKNTTLFVLIDNIDAFVIKEEYKTQKNVLEALLLCQTGYDITKNIQIKLFLRTDLFRRINKAELGSMKIRTRCVYGKWTDDNIRQFIARRILYNLNLFLRFKQSNKKPLHKILSWITRRKHNDKGDIRFSYQENELYAYKRRRETDKDKGLDYDSRTLNLTDKISRDLITFIFPKTVTHILLNGKEEEICIFEYFSKHFNLAYGYTTPRIIIIFLNEVLLQAKEYLRCNPDEADMMVNRTKDEFALVRKRYIKDAYPKFQECVWSSFIEETKSPVWQGYLEILKRKIPVGDTILSFKKLHNYIESEQTLETEKFLGYCTHIGLLACLNHGESAHKLKYKLPILFQKIDRTNTSI